MGKRSQPGIYCRASPYLFYSLGGETLKKRNQISALPISIRCGPNQRTRKKEEDEEEEEEEASGRGEFRTHDGAGIKFANFKKISGNKDGTTSFQ